MENDDLGDCDGYRFIAPDIDAMNRFLGDDDGFTPIVRIDSAEIVYEEDILRVSFIGDKYMKGALMGEGSYSKVKEVLDITTLSRRAIKIVKLRKIRRIPNGRENVQREIKILRRLSHENIVSLIETFTNMDKEKLYIVLEYCCCNLQAMLESTDDKTFAVWQSHLYFTQLIQGLDYLHSKNIVHKDIKPGNLLLTIDQRLKISDFGVSEELDRFAADDKITTSQGSPAFQAPEIANGDDWFYGFKVDTWACGITLFNMVTGAYPFEGENIYKLFENISTGVFTMPGDLPENLQDLLHGLLKKEPVERFSTEEVLKHDWFIRHHPEIEPGVPLPVEGDNTLFAMTTLPSLEKFVNPVIHGEAGQILLDEEIIQVNDSNNIEHVQTINIPPPTPQHNAGEMYTATPSGGTAAGSSSNNHLKQKKVKKKGCHLM